MIFSHHDLRIELDNAWWNEAMAGSTVSGPAFRTDPGLSRNRAIFHVAINDIEPVRRNLSHGVFNDDGVNTAHDRVVSILRAFRQDIPLPPVEVVRMPPGSPRHFKLTAGVHRLYCSLAAGFPHVPAVIGFDMAAETDT